MSFRGVYDVAISLLKTMNNTPHIIQEGSVQYQLGKQKGNQIIYDFPKMLIYLEAKGKLLFGKNFKIYAEDETILYKLCIEVLFLLRES